MASGDRTVLCRLAFSRSTTGGAFVRSEQAPELSFLQNEPLGEAPGAAAPLVLEVDQMGPGTRVPKGIPEHWEIVTVRGKSNNMLDADSVRISAFKPVSDVQRSALALARAAQKTLIPAAWRQLIPDEGSDAA